MNKKDQLKKIIKSNKKVLYSFILGLLISTGLVYVYADTYLYSASNVYYDNSTSGLTSENLQAAIDEVRPKCTRYDVNVTVNNGTVSGSSTKNIRTGKTTTFTVNPNSNYGNGTVSCTNGQTATLSGSTVTTGAITNNTTCTVTYTPTTYTLTVNPNGGSISGKTTNYTVTQNYNTKLAIPKPTRSGYEFTGWTLSGSGSLTKYGKGLYNDDGFASSNNSMSIYNNSGGGTVTHEKIATTSDNPMKNSSYVIKIATNGAASPGLGGFYQGTQSRANAVFYHVIVAKIPEGYYLHYAQNATGDGRTIEWLTPNIGTGKYETYIYKHTCGSSGTFSTLGFVYVSTESENNWVAKTGNVTWYVAYANMFDYTASPNAQDGQVFTYGAGNTTLTANWVQSSKTVTVVVNNGTISGDSTKTVNYNTSTTFTVTPSTNYGGGQVSCTNSQTASISGTTLTTGNITQDTTCTVTFELGAACSGASGTTNGYCAYGQECKTGYSSYCTGWGYACEACGTCRGCLQYASSGLCLIEGLLREDCELCGCAQFATTQSCTGGYSSYSYNYCG